MTRASKPAPLTSAGSFWQRWKAGVTRLWQQSDWPRWIGDRWPQEIMRAGVTDAFHAKQGRSTGRLVLNSQGERFGVFLKRHYELPWWQGWLSLIWPAGGRSPAVEEFRNLEWAQECGLPVPNPVAVAEYVGPRMRLQSVLVIEELVGMLPLHEAIPLAQRRLDPIAFRQWKKGLARELARLTRVLHDRNAFHKDLYLCHFFIPEECTARIPEWKGRVHMIDFHRLAQHSFGRLVWLIKDLGQFLFSSAQEGVDAKDRLWFWRCYTGEKKARKTWLARLVQWKFGVYRRHNQKAQIKKMRRAA